VWDEVKLWLTRGNLITNTDIVDFNSLDKDFQRPCRALDICGNPNVNITEIAIPKPNEDRYGAMVVIFRLNKTILDTVPRGTEKWKSFARSFIQVVSEALGAAPQRCVVIFSCFKWKGASRGID